MVRPVVTDRLPTVLTGFGGCGFSALAISSDGFTIASATDEFINIYPTSSIWLPSFSLNVPTAHSPINFKLQRLICADENCKCKSTLPQYVKPPLKKARRKYGMKRVVYLGVIQHLQFFGQKNEFLVALGPFFLLIYDLSTMDLNPLISIDMRYFGLDTVAYPYILLCSFTVLNIHRNFIYHNRLLTCVEFMFSHRPYVPTYYRVVFNERRWWIVDCQATTGLIKQESLDDDVPYNVFNHFTTMEYDVDLSEKFRYELQEEEPYVDLTPVSSDTGKSYSEEICRMRMYEYRLVKEMQNREFEEAIFKNKTKLPKRPGRKPKRTRSKLAFRNYLNNFNAKLSLKDTFINGLGTITNPYNTPRISFDNGSQSDFHYSHSHTNTDYNSSPRDYTFDYRDYRLGSGDYKFDYRDYSSSPRDYRFDYREHRLGSVDSSSSPRDHKLGSGDHTFSYGDNRLDYGDNRLDYGDPGLNCGDPGLNNGDPGLNNGDRRLGLDTNSNPDLAGVFPDLSELKQELDEEIHNDPGSSMDNNNDNKLRDEEYVSGINVNSAFNKPFELKSIYFPFCLLKKKFTTENLTSLLKFSTNSGHSGCTQDNLESTVDFSECSEDNREIPRDNNEIPGDNLENSEYYLKYVEEFVFAGFVPVSTIVMIKFTVETYLHVESGVVRSTVLGRTDSKVLADLTISNLPIRVHMFIPNPLGNQFVILVYDRFYVFKYTTANSKTTKLIFKRFFTKSNTNTGCNTTHNTVTNSTVVSSNSVDKGSSQRTDESKSGPIVTSGPTVNIADDKEDLVRSTADENMNFVQPETPEDRDLSPPKTDETLLTISKSPEDKELTTTNTTNNTTITNNNNDVSSLRLYEVVVENELVVDSLRIYYCHYDPVLKLRYSLGCFSNARVDGYLAMCTNYSSQWGFQIFDLRCKSGVDGLKLVMDASKCKGFIQMSWVPNTNKFMFISRLNGELYQLEPKTRRNWVGLISNFKSIEKNLEYIEPEDIFDIDPETGKSADSTVSAELYGDIKSGTHTKNRKRYGSVRYPFYEPVFSIIGDEYVKYQQELEINEVDPEYHTSSPEIQEYYQSVTKPINLI